MAKNNKFFDDLAKLASSSFSSLMSLKGEITNMVKDQMRTQLKSMDFVTRAEFNALKKVVMKQNPDAFKKAAPAKKAPAKKAPVKKAPAKKAAPKKKAVKK